MEKVERPSLPPSRRAPCLFFQLLSELESHKSGFVSVNICFAVRFDLAHSRVQRARAEGLARGPAAMAAPSTGPSARPAAQEPVVPPWPSALPGRQVEFPRQGREGCGSAVSTPRAMGPTVGAWPDPRDFSPLQALLEWSVSARSVALTWYREARLPVQLSGRWPRVLGHGHGWASRAGNPGLAGWTPFMVAPEPGLSTWDPGAQLPAGRALHPGGRLGWVLDGALVTRVRFSWGCHPVTCPAGNWRGRPAQYHTAVAGPLRRQCHCQVGGTTVWPSHGL